MPDPFPHHTEAPGRVNLIGDHTDYTGGLALPMAIDRWTRIAHRPAEAISLVSADEAGTVTVVPGREEDVVAGNDDQPRWGRYVAAVAAELGHYTPIDGTVTTTLPVGSGLSSSASLEIAVALALGYDGDRVELARLCQRAENRATGVPTGIMDQLCIVSGVDGAATLIDCHDLAVTTVTVPEDLKVVVRFVAHRRLEGSEYDTRVAECASAEAVIGPLRLASLDDVAAIDDPVVRARATHVVTENDRVRAFVDALAAADGPRLGAIMVDGHASLRDHYATSTPAMDAAVDELCRTPGVFGARMTGGGFGGCVVALCDTAAEVDGWVVRPVAGARRLD